MQYDDPTRCETSNSREKTGTTFWSKFRKKKDRHCYRFYSLLYQFLIFIYARKILENLMTSNHQINLGFLT